MDIKNLKPSKSQFKQGYYMPKDPDKYIGDLTKIIFRSSWELKFMKYCDNFSSIIKWSSEPIPIPYYSPIDEKMHKYNVDFYMRYIMEDGQEKDYIVEIKPLRDTVPPKKPTKNTIKSIKYYNRDMKTFIVNNAKFNAASAFGKDRGMEFLVLSEDFLFNEKIKFK